jgi:hypothetical protein
MAFNFREAMRRYIPKSKENAKIYLYGAGDNWSNIRRMYMSFTNTALEYQVDYFVDGNPAKQGSHIGNTKIISPDEIDRNNCVIFITTNSHEHEIGQGLAQNGLVGCFDFYDSYYITSILFEYAISRTMSLRNSKIGERCFVIGNGPSLSARDLDVIQKHNIPTFAVNQIFKIFDRTDWRPSHYVVSDYFAVKNFEEYNSKINGIKFINMNYAKLIDNFHADNAYYFIENDIMLLLSHLAKPKVGEEIYDLNSGGTTLFSALQLAFYLGFSEIYLLGADNSFKYEKSCDGELLVDGSVTKLHFVDDYLPKNSHSALFDAQFGYQTAEAYKSAASYAKEHGITLRNATRGGKLEVVERVDFDLLFGGD